MHITIKIVFKTLTKLRNRKKAAIGLLCGKNATTAVLWDR